MLRYSVFAPVSDLGPCDQSERGPVISPCGGLVDSGSGVVDGTGGLFWQDVGTVDKLKFGFDKVRFIV